MALRNHADDQDRGTESKFYLPVGVTPPFDASRFKRVWARLFNHAVEAPE